MSQSDPVIANQRQLIYCRLLGAAAGQGETGASLEGMTAELAQRLELPSAILNPRSASTSCCTAIPNWSPTSRRSGVASRRRRKRSPTHRRASIRSRGRSRMTTSTCAGRSPSRSCCSTCSVPIRARPRARRPSTASGARTWPPSNGAWASNRARCAPGGQQPSGAIVRRLGLRDQRKAPRVDDEQLREELVAMESDLVKRMDLREVLKDDRLAPSSRPRCRWSSSCSTTSGTCPGRRSPTRGN